MIGISKKKQDVIKEKFACPAEFPLCEKKNEQRLYKMILIIIYIE
jgi:hypothetical protein